jgi:hypothetical protein
MALVIADRVRETTTTAGTGSVTLAGAVTGFQSFSVIGDTNTCYYCISDQSGSNWEVGIGTYSTTGPTLARTTVLASSNAGSLVSFGSNTKDVFVTQPAERAVYTQATGNRIEIYNPVVPLNNGNGVIECVDDGIGDSYNDLNIYAEDSFGLKYAPFFNAGISSADFVIRSQDWTTNYHFVQLFVPSGMTGDYTLTLPSSPGSANQVLKTDGTGVTSWTNTFILGAGTATVAPLQLTSGTNLTTPSAGAMEYDGKLAYFTPANTSRALLPNHFYYRKNTSTTLSNATGNQSIFGLTSGVTLAASTIYEIDGEFQLTTTGTTSHTESFGFVLTTATLSNMGVTVDRWITNNTAATGRMALFLTAVAPTAITAAITTAQTAVYRIRGTIAVSTGGSCSPVIAFSTAPGGTSTITAGAWIRFTPIGTAGSNVSIGTWS